MPGAAPYYKMYTIQERVGKNMNIPQGKKELALRYVRENQREHAMSCSESVFNALVRSGVIAVQEDWTRIATGLSGGVAASGNTCGAVCGGLMALGWALII